MTPNERNKMEKKANRKTDDVVRCGSTAPHPGEKVLHFIYIFCIICS